MVARLGQRGIKGKRKEEDAARLFVGNVFFLLAEKSRLLRGTEERTDQRCGATALTAFVVRGSSARRVGIPDGHPPDLRYASSDSSLLFSRNQQHLTKKQPHKRPPPSTVQQQAITTCKAHCKKQKPGFRLPSEIPLTEPFPHQRCIDCPQRGHCCASLDFTPRGKRHPSFPPLSLHPFKEVEQLWCWIMLGHLCCLCFIKRL